jgi:hypothetical protein
MSRRSAPRESSITAQIMTALRRVPRCIVRKRHSAGWGVAGDPDLYGSIGGQHFEVEVKRPGEQPTPLQEARLAQWRDSGAIAGVAHSIDEALALLGVEQE